MHTETHIHILPHTETHTHTQEASQGPPQDTGSDWICSLAELLPQSGGRWQVGVGQRGEHQLLNCTCGL